MSKSDILNAVTNFPRQSRRKGYESAIDSMAVRVLVKSRYLFSHYHRFREGINYTKHLFDPLYKSENGNGKKFLLI